MQIKYQKTDILYRPVLFIMGTFMLTWCCAGLMTKINANTHIIIYTFLDFIENASPLFCAMLLLGRYFTTDKFLWKFFLGEPSKIYSYFIVFILFAAQFFNFYCFQVEAAEFSVQTFAVTFAGQFLLGGGLEEAGWRGYLLPCFHKKYNIVISSISVSIIWVLWHLPYFFISGSMQANGNFYMYAIIGIITGFILSAIYLFTRSVLLCMLFHSWQNTIVMTIQANMEDMRFLLFFIALGVVSVLLCMKQNHGYSSTCAKIE